MPTDANYSITGGRLPYERCLIPNLPEDLQHQMRDIANFLCIPVSMLFAVLSLIVNSLLLTVIVRMRSLQHPSQLLLCSLSFTDLLWGIICVGMNIARFTDENMCVEQNNENDALYILCYTSTIGNLAIISRDRYVAVSRPLWYRTHMTRARIIRQAIAVWLFSGLHTLHIYLSATFSLMEYLVVEIITKSVISLYWSICILTIICTYVGILRSSRRHMKNMPQLGVHLRSVLKREKKMTSTVTSILVVLVFTFLPALVLPIILVVTGFDFRRLPSLEPFYELLVSINGLLNPLINFGRNKNVRESFRNLIACSQRDGQIAPSTATGDGHLERQ